MRLFGRLLAAVAATFLAVTAHGDKLVLKDGRELEGDVILKGNTVTLLSGGKVYQFSQADIRSRVGVPTTAAAANTEEAGDPAGTADNSPVLQLGAGSAIHQAAEVTMFHTRGTLPRPKCPALRHRAPAE